MDIDYLIIHIIYMASSNGYPDENWFKAQLKLINREIIIYDKHFYQ